MADWMNTFRRRMQGFEARRPPADGQTPLSIKVRVMSGCFHREHSPHAYEIIDSHPVSADDSAFGFEEHESGPEILAYVVAGVGLAKSIIDVIVMILKARAEGIKKGDRPRDPLVLTVRKVDSDGFKEEVVLQVDYHDPVMRDEIGKALDRAVERLLATEQDAAGPKPGK